MHESALQQLTQSLEDNKKQLISQYDRKMLDLEKELRLRMKVEIHEIEERKNQHINDLMINHETAFREMKEYYNDITRENLDIIKQLQDRYQDLKTQKASSEKIVAALKETVKGLKQPLAEELQECELLRKQVQNHSIKQMGFRNAKGSLEDLQKRMKNLREEKAKLDEKYDRTQAEIRSMSTNFEAAIE